jgi:hypothetical protein
MGTYTEQRANLRLGGAGMLTSKLVCESSTTIAPWLLSPSAGRRAHSRLSHPDLFDSSCTFRSSKGSIA